MSFNVSSQNESAVVMNCSFCGIQNSSHDRCSGCGAAYSIQPPAAAQPQTFSNRRNRKIGYVGNFALALAAGLCIYFFSVSEKTAWYISDVRTGSVLHASSTEPDTLMNVQSLAEVKLSTADIKHRLAAIPTNYEIYYAGVREPISTARPVVINVKKTRETVVLALSSYNAVQWHVSNPHGTKIAAIVYGSSTGKSAISGDIDQADILPGYSPIGSYYQPQNCECVSTSYQCIGDDFATEMRAVRLLGNGRLTGVTYRSRASSVTVPELAMNAAMRLERKQRQSNEKLKSQCFNQASAKSWLSLQ